MVSDRERLLERLDGAAQLLERQLVARLAEPAEHLFAQAGKVGAVIYREQPADAGVLGNQRARLAELARKARLTRQQFHGGGEDGLVDSPGALRRPDHPFQPVASIDDGARHAAEAAALQLDIALRVNDKVHEDQRRQF